MNALAKQPSGAALRRSFRSDGELPRVLPMTTAMISAKNAASAAAVRRCRCAWRRLRAAALVILACCAAGAQEVPAGGVQGVPAGGVQGVPADPAQAASYRLHPGDLVRLEVFDE